MYQVPQGYMTAQTIEITNRIGRKRLEQIKAKRRNGTGQVQTFERMLKDLPNAIAARPLVVDGKEITL